MSITFISVNVFRQILHYEFTKLFLVYSTVHIERVGTIFEYTRKRQWSAEYEHAKRHWIDVAHVNELSFISHIGLSKYDSRREECKREIILYRNSVIYLLVLYSLLLITSSTRRRLLTTSATYITIMRGLEHHDATASELIWEWG